MISEIARLSSDTLVDQRTAQEETKVKKSPKLFKHKPKSKGASPKQASPRFTRTKSGATVSHTIPAPIPQTRSLSPPPNLTGSLPPRAYFPPPPASDPPNMSFSTLNRPYNHYGQWDYNHPTYHQHQRSGDAMSGISMGSGSSVDSITHELSTDRRTANRMQLNQWVMQSQTSMASSVGGPNFFPTALGSMDTLERSHPGINQSSSLSRQQAAMMNSFLKRGGEQQQLDTVVSDAYNNQRHPNWHQQQQLQQQQQSVGNVGSNAGVPPSSYPWKTVHQKPRARHPSDQGSIVSDDGQQFSDSSSMVSNSSSSRGMFSQKPAPLSPTTHVLVVEESQSSETYV